MSKFRLYSKFFIFLHIFIISIIFGYRDLDVGSDTRQYKSHFLRAMGDSYYDRFEPGFSLYLNLFAKLGFSVELFFVAHAFIVLSILYFTFSRILVYIENDRKKWILHFFFFSSFILFSSWVFVAITNGFRQGLAVSIVIYSFSFLVKETNWLKLFLTLALAVSFHYSVALILPFIILYKLPLRFLALIWFLLAIMYPLGVNEVIVKTISEFSGIQVYEKIAYYGQTSQDDVSSAYYGFVPTFFLYTIFWPLVVFFYIKHKGLSLKDTERLMLYSGFLKFYMILSLPYFVFGFGPFSNRYAFLAWLIVPFFQYLIVSILKIKYKLLVSIFFYFSSIIHLIFYINTQ